VRGEKFKLLLNKEAVTT